MWDSGHERATDPAWECGRWLQEAITDVLTAREQHSLAAILSDYHGRRCVRDAVFSLAALLDTPAKRHLLPMLRHVVPVADRREWDRHATRLLQEAGATGVGAGMGAGNGSGMGTGMGTPTLQRAVGKDVTESPAIAVPSSPHVYPKSVLKKSHSMTMSRGDPLTPRPPASSSSYIAPFSQPVLPAWDSPGIANQVRAHRNTFCREQTRFPPFSRTDLFSTFF
jgi:hypothetical protein